MHSLQPCQLGNDSLPNMVPIPPSGQCLEGSSLCKPPEVPGGISGLRWLKVSQEWPQPVGQGRKSQKSPVSLEEFERGTRRLAMTMAYPIWHIRAAEELIGDCNPMQVWQDTHIMALLATVLRSNHIQSL